MVYIPEFEAVRLRLGQSVHLLIPLWKNLKLYGKITDIRRFEYQQNQSNGSEYTC